ncbi:benzoate/H(+) symporter BenE family transporter [Zavarzinia compransoris]|uniref:Benzoate transporter n=1 Tax=Zavarzinia compransoris TaxID=1264899 RepID=A0A317E9G2_9PROT|nr:benzoate/H(+) symporter BenE family transporter [Zavarzinia compransoris]PWR21765.1 benzoate transporter [Zavarzinia compransoris]TDP45437.1 benzoate membrane transport protein [Zavarzinia compransoris]
MEQAQRPEWIRPATAGVMAAVVGFASSFAVVLEGLRAMGATPGQAASGLLVLCLAMGGLGVVLSLRLKMPVSIAWSTPGAALLAATAAPAGGFAAAVGAFLVAALLVVVAGLWRPFGRLVAAIPATLAGAMLAGVLLGLCLAPFKAVGLLPLQALPVVLAWAVTMRLNRLWAVPVALAVTVAVLVLDGGALAALPAGRDLAPHLEAVMPVFDPQTMVGVGLPLFLVTMASQNVPGLAVLQTNGYRPAPGPLFVATGVVSALAAPFGGHAVNLAAITAALCAGPDAAADPGRRWLAAVIGGAGYVAIGAVATLAAALAAAAPPVLIQAVAGLALIGAFGNALNAALAVPAEREAALVTFLVTASGLSFGGIGAAFWGLLAGGALWWGLRRH